MQNAGPTPAVQIIESLRKARGLSVRKASQAAELSEGRWRQIAKGYQQVTKEVRAPVVAPIETVVRMARAVGVDPSDLRIAGELEVARALAGYDAPAPHGDEEIEHRGPVPPEMLRYASHKDLLRELERRLNEGSKEKEVVGNAEHPAPMNPTGESPVKRHLTAVESPAPTVDEPATETKRAARKGRPGALPDTTTGEESQDNGSIEPS